MIGDKKPKRIHTLLETRALLEAALHFGSRPLHRLLPTGDGHPVLVIPGFLASDGLTAQFRKALNTLDYAAYGWQLGANPGIRQDYLKATETLLKELVMVHSQPVTLVGWSLGGMYARSLANLNPKCVRQVITLGSPFGIPTEYFSGVQSGIAKLYETFNRLDDPMLKTPQLWQETPSVPCTAIYTETDGIVHWHYCMDKHTDTSQNIRVRGSHAGLVHNPLALYLVADRLQYKAKNWKHFELKGWHQWLFDSRCVSEIDGQDIPTLLDEDAITISN